MQFNDDLAAGVVLVRPALQSPDYDPGVAGWMVSIEGNAEFNDLTLRGTFLGTNFVLDSSGLFLYSGTPANGNLIANITAAAGVDEFGNTYLAGIVSYSGPVFASLNDSNLLLGLVSEAIDAGVVGLAGGDELFISSPTHNKDPATIAVTNGLDSTTPRSSAAYPHIEVGASSAGTTGWINGAWIHSTVNGGVSTPEAWQTPSYAANWSGTGTLAGVANYQPLRMRLDAEDNVWFEGCFQAAAGAGSTVFTAPAGYYNTTTLHPFPVVLRQAAGTWQTGIGYIGTTGNFHIDLGNNFTRNAGDVYSVNAKVPLGNVA
jgi:hypothetical protein